MPKIFAYHSLVGLLTLKNPTTKKHFCDRKRDQTRTMPSFTKSLLFILIVTFSETSKSQDSEGTIFTKSIELYQNKKYAESSVLLEQLVKQNPKRSLYWFNLGNTSFMLKNYSLSIKQFEKVVSLNYLFVAAARLNKSKALKMLGLHEQANKELDWILNQSSTGGIYSEAISEKNRLEDISNSEIEALKNYQKNEFNSGEMLLKSVDQESLSLDGLTLLGLSLLKQNKYTESEQIFLNLSKNSFLSQEQRHINQELMLRSRKKEANVYPYWLSLDLSSGNTSNAYLDGKSLTPVSSPINRSFIGFGYSFNQEQAFFGKIGYTLNYEEPTKATGLKTLSQTVQGSLAYRSSFLETSVSSYVQTQSWNNIIVSRKLGALAQILYTSDSRESGIDIDLNSLQPSSVDYSYLNGTSYSIKPYFGFWSEQMYLQIFCLFGADGTSDITYSDGSRLPIVNSVFGPGVRLLWKATDKTLALFGVNYLRREYKNIELPGLQKREDQEISGFIKLTYYLFPKFSIYGLGEYTSNSSTLGAAQIMDKNYTLTVISLGFAWEVF